MSERDRRTGPRELSVAVTPRYRLMWGLVRAVVRPLFEVPASGLEQWPNPPFQLVANHHNGWDRLRANRMRSARPPADDDKECHGPSGPNQQGSQLVHSCSSCQHPGTGGSYRPPVCPARLVVLSSRGPRHIGTRFERERDTSGTDRGTRSRSRAGHVQTTRHSSSPPFSNRGGLSWRPRFSVRRTVSSVGSFSPSSSSARQAAVMSFTDRAPPPISRAMRAAVTSVFGGQTGVGGRHWSASHCGDLLASDCSTPEGMACGRGRLAPGQLSGPFSGGARLNGAVYGYAW